MARIKGGMNAKKKHNRVLKLAKGYRGAIRTNYKKANEAVKKAMAYATKHRKLKKRKMRELWIIRINAASRLNGLSYSRFMNGLRKAEIELDRKVLADLALNNAAEFAKLVQIAKDAK